MKVDTTPDFSDARALAEALLQQAEVIRGLAPSNAKARTVLNYASDRQNVALAIATKRAKEAGCKSMAEAETFALASDEYQARLAELEAEYLAAENVAQQHRAAETKHAALITATSLQKAINSQL